MDDKFIFRSINAAVQDGDADRVEKLLKNDKTILEMDTPFGSWLHIAADEGQYEVVKRLIELGIDINKYSGIEGGGALNLAASEGHIDICKYLIEHGAELDVSEPERNPLFSAIHHGHTEIVKLLLEAGIDKDVKYTGETMKNMDALAFAYEWGRKEIADILKGY